MSCLTAGATPAPMGAEESVFRQESDQIGIAGSAFPASARLRTSFHTKQFHHRSVWPGLSLFASSLPSPQSQYPLVLGKILAADPWPA